MFSSLLGARVVHQEIGQILRITGRGGRVHRKQVVLGRESGLDERHSLVVDGYEVLSLKRRPMGRGYSCRRLWGNILRWRIVESSGISRSAVRKHVQPKGQGDKMPTDNVLVANWNNFAPQILESIYMTPNPHRNDHVLCQIGTIKWKS